MAWSTIFSLIYFVGLAAATTNSSCTYPWCFSFRLNNCLNVPMVFQGCQAIGDWVTKPTTIPNMGHTTIGIKGTGLLTATVGNCTWNYTNSHGTWVAFADWDFATLGDQSCGGGTGDERDSEATSLGNTNNGNTCLWFWYTSGSWDSCFIGTNDTTCTPASYSGRSAKGVRLHTKKVN